jgi:Ca2+-dependent lipid-binding protein
VYDLDVDGELWLKLRLAPVKPYVGTLSLAFVQLPTIKLVLAPFRLVNLFSIPFLSNFLSKLLTVDLPRLLVLPRHITFDFLPQGQNAMESVEAMEASLESGVMDESVASGVLDLLKSGVTETAPQQAAEPSEAFVGELSVTVCEARDLPIRGFTGWSNPYCILALGDQVIESKRNKETSHPAGHKDPVWNQDFQFLVEDPGRQKLMLRVRDSTLTLNPNIGYCRISLTDLKVLPGPMYGIFVNHDLFFNPKQSFQDGDICQPWTQSSLSHITNLLSHVGCSHDTGDCLLSVLKKETC